MPVPWVQRNASHPLLDDAIERLSPTITEPSAFAPYASAKGWIPTGTGRWPMPTIPSPSVHRNASVPSAVIEDPTMVSPSALMPYAEPPNVPPGRSPRPRNVPSGLVYRNGSAPLSDSPGPAITRPSLETPRAAARAEPDGPPGRSPISTVPVPGVQTKATICVGDSTP